MSIFDRLMGINLTKTVPTDEQFIKEFKSWVLKKHPDQEYNYQDRTGQCALGQFLTESKYVKGPARVEVDRWGDWTYTNHNNMIPSKLVDVLGSMGVDQFLVGFTGQMHEDINTFGDLAKRLETV